MSIKLIQVAISFFAISCSLTSVKASEKILPLEGPYSAEEIKRHGSIEAALDHRFFTNHILQNRTPEEQQAHEYEDKWMKQHNVIVDKMNEFNKSKSPQTLEEAGQALLTSITFAIHAHQLHPASMTQEITSQRIVSTLDTFQKFSYLVPKYSLNNDIITTKFNTIITLLSFRCEDGNLNNFPEAHDKIKALEKLLIK